MAAEPSLSTALPVPGPAGAPGAPPAGVVHREFARAVRAILRDGGPVIGIMWLFQCLETYTGVIRQTSIESSLNRADLALFGVEPTVWLSKHSTPLLTDYMALAYGSQGVDIFAGLLVGAAATCLAPTLRMRWPKLAHGS